MAASSPVVDTDLRRLILDTTRHLLVEDGYTALSMRKIARSIGYSATTIYLYFENKDALFHALIDEGMARLYEVLQAIEAEHPDDLVQRLEALCRGYVAFGLANREYYEIMFTLHPKHMARFPAEKYRRGRRNLDLFARLLEAGIEEGLFVPVPPRVTASTIWAALHGIVSLLIAERVDIRIDADAFLEGALAQTFRGVLRGDRTT